MSHKENKLLPIDLEKIELSEAIARVCQFPAVADKKFLITIGDRSVGGMVARDQLVGPWQVAVSDVAVTTAGFTANTAEALAMGERTPVAMIDSAKAARLAVGEAITNIASAKIDRLEDITLSANWMAASHYEPDALGLYEAVKTVGMEFCPALGVCIPVGKDSMSMQASWEEGGQTKKVIAPVSLIVTAAGLVSDVRKTKTPLLEKDFNTKLILLDLSEDKSALGASSLAQVYQMLGEKAPDIDVFVLKNFFHAIQELNAANYLLAYHDRSDGGLLATVCEMSFATHQGITLNLDGYHENIIEALFNESLGAVIQVADAEIENVFALFKKHQLSERAYLIGELNQSDELVIRANGKTLYQNSRIHLHKLWSETSYQIQKLRDNPRSAELEYAQIEDQNDPGLQVELSFHLPTKKDIHLKTVRPKVAILREQGVNGHIEMAAAFYHAGFECVDVHMSALISGDQNLDSFIGLAACGGFSYGDVLGAGRGWAQSICLHPKVRDQFAQFFERNNTFSLGVCNGCQMFSQLKAIIPGAKFWPNFYRNESEQFEARFSLIKVQSSPSIFFQGMEGSVFPVAVAHGEGRAVFADVHDLKIAKEQNGITLNFVDHNRKETERYPFNPNGSANGITGLTSKDGRVTILMPHPERVFRTVQNSWHPKEWEEYGPWMQFFNNAYDFVN